MNPELIPLIEPFGKVSWLETMDGYVVWRRGTGDNVELLHLKSKASGGGTRLLRGMLEALEENPPYSTVFGFTRLVNDKAHSFYLKCGFDLTMVQGVYADGHAIVFSAPYSDLRELHCENHSGL